MLQTFKLLYLDLRLGPFKLIRGDPGWPDGWIGPDQVVDQERKMGAGGGKNQQLLLFNLDSDPYEAVNLVICYPASLLTSTRQGWSPLMWQRLCLEATLASGEESGVLDGAMLLQWIHPRVRKTLGCTKLN